MSPSNRPPYLDYKVSLRLVREPSKNYTPVRLDSPRDVYAFMRDITDRDRECFYSLHLDGKNRVVGCEEVSVGSLQSAMIHPREVFKSAILSNAASIVVVHNHPSGDPAPSPEDLEVTRRLYEAGQILGIQLLDSIVVGTQTYYSAAGAGVLNPPSSKYG